MPDSVLELAERGRALNPQERARLVDLLLATLDDASTSEGRPGTEKLNVASPPTRLERSRPTISRKFWPKPDAWLREEGTPNCAATSTPVSMPRSRRRWKRLLSL